LTTLCRELGVPAAEVIAFGDMPNDLPMLAWAGRSYAMANAHQSVLDAADFVAPAASTMASRRYWTRSSVAAGSGRTIDRGTAPDSRTTTGEIDTNTGARP